MRFAMCIAAFGAVCLSVPATAQVAPMTVVQVDTLAVDYGFKYFDTSLGVLLSVRLDITPNFRRGFQVIVPGHADTAAVSWDASNEQFCRYGSCTNLIASGSTSLPLTYSEGLFGGSSYGYIGLSFSGPTISADLDPTQFVNPPFPEFRRFLTQPDPGLYDDTLLDIFQVDTPGGYVRMANGVFNCRSSISGCDTSIYRLTYVYAPGGVPEPATWGLMILGFGMMGAALRRSHPRHRADLRGA